MSIHVMSPVFRCQMKDPTQKLVLLALADFAHDDGTNAFPSNATLAIMCGCSERTIRRQLQQSILDGYISVQRSARHHVPTTYLFHMECIRQGGQFVQNGPESGQDAQAIWSPEANQGGHSYDPLPVIDPSVDPSTLSVISLNGHKSKKATTVPDDWRLTDSIHKWAEQKGYTRKQVLAEEERFRCHEFKSAHTDWDRAFMRWMTHPDFGPKPELVNGKPKLFVG